MSKTLDNLIAFKVLSMLVTPFEKSNAFKLGIIDKDGKALKKVKDLTTSDEKDSYSALDRLVFNLKRLLAKVPGGKSQLASLIAAYWLIKESHQSYSTIDEHQLLDLINTIETKNITFVEEEILIEKFLEQIGEDGIANITGAGVSTDQPVVKKKPQVLRRKIVH